MASMTPRWLWQQRKLPQGEGFKPDGRPNVADDCRRLVQRFQPCRLRGGGFSWVVVLEAGTRVTTYSMDAWNSDVLDGAVTSWVPIDVRGGGTSDVKHSDVHNYSLHKKERSFLGMILLCSNFSILDWKTSALSHPSFSLIVFRVVHTCTISHWIFTNSYYSCSPNYITHTYKEKQKSRVDTILFLHLHDEEKIHSYWNIWQEYMTKELLSIFTYSTNKCLTFTRSSSKNYLLLLLLSVTFF